MELRDGSIVRVLTIRPEPGYGFVTLVPFREHGTPEELIVPMGAVAGFKLTVVEEESPFGFSLPAPRG